MGMLNVNSLELGMVMCDCGGVLVIEAVFMHLGAKFVAISRQPLLMER
jgi:hypothetical protein